MKLRVNGEEYLTESATLLDLLGELRIAPERVAVEVNLKVIKRADVPSLSLREGDVVEIVNFVGGGAPVISWAVWGYRQVAIYGAVGGRE
ncbi:MAG: sulfur carrier protein ThiS [Chloroflexota bacterium]